MLGGNRSLLLHPRPLRRKTSYLDGYYKNGIPVTTAQIGDNVSYDVPGHSPGQVFLVQTVNGAPNYSGPFTVPMPARLLGPGDKTGLYQNTVYDRQGGTVIETDSLQVNPSPYTQGGGGPSQPINCGPGLVPYAGYTDANGNWNAPGCMYPKAGASTPTPASSTTTSTTTTSTTAGSSGGGGAVQGGFPTGGQGGQGGGSPFAPPPAPSNTLLIAAAAALALVILS